MFLPQNSENLDAYPYQVSNSVKPKNTPSPSQLCHLTLCTTQIDWLGSITIFCWCILDGVWRIRWITQRTWNALACRITQVSWLVGLDGFADFSSFGYSWMANHYPLSTFKCLAAAQPQNDDLVLSRCVCNRLLALQSAFWYLQSSTQPGSITCGTVRLTGRCSAQTWENCWMVQSDSGSNVSMYDVDKHAFRASQDKPTTQMRFWWWYWWPPIKDYLANKYSILD